MSGLTATPISSSTIVVSAGERPFVNYQLRINFSTIIDLDLPSYVDSGLAPETTRTYEIRSTFTEGTDTFTGPWSLPVSATTFAEDPVVTDLETPVILNAFLSALETVSLTWTAVPGAEGYEVRRNAGTPVDVGNVLERVEPGLSDGTYVYEVRAYADGLDPSDWSAPATAEVQSLVAPEVTATVVSNSAIKLDWLYVPPATRFEVRIDGGVPLNVGAVLTYLHTGLERETAYSYEVRAVSGEVEGPWSAVQEATTFPFVVPGITPILQRLSYFLSRREINARALNREFNNIYAVLGATSGDNPQPGPDPEPPPEPEPPVPPPPDPEPPEPTPEGEVATYTINDPDTSHVLTLPAANAGDLVMVVAVGTGGLSAANISEDPAEVWRSSSWYGGVTDAAGPIRGVRVFTRIMSASVNPATITVNSTASTKLVAYARVFPGLTSSQDTAVAEVKDTAFSTNVLLQMPGFAGYAPAPGIDDPDNWAWLATGMWRGGQRKLLLAELPASEGWTLPALLTTDGDDPDVDHTLVVQTRKGGNPVTDPFRWRIDGSSTSVSTRGAIGLFAPW